MQAEEDPSQSSTQGDRLLHVTDDDVSQILCALESAVLAVLSLHSAESVWSSGNDRSNG
jgi:hypothetical protein